MTREVGRWARTIQALNRYTGLGELLLAEPAATPDAGPGRVGAAAAALPAVPAVETATNRRRQMIAWGYARGEARGLVSIHTPWIASSVSTESPYGEPHVRWRGRAEG